MANKGKSRLGDVAGLGAVALTYATTNWGVLMSAVLGLGAGVWNDAFKFLNDPRIETIGWVFLLSLWTWIGLSILNKLNTRVTTRPEVDYAFGVIVENLGLAVDPAPDGRLQFNLQIRNVANAAIKFQVIDVRVVLGERTPPDNDKKLSVVLPRLGQKGFGMGLFNKSDMPDGSEAEGSIYMVAVYGPHDGDPVRKRTIRIKTLVKRAGIVFGLSNEHVNDDDEEYK